MFYLYILYSASSDKYYIGYSNDHERRVLEHNNSERNTFTSKYRPWILRAVFSCGTIEAEAVRIERIIEGEPLTGILAQLVRVPHVRD